VGHSIDEFQGQISQLLIGVDEGFKKGEFRMDVFSYTFLKQISTVQYLFHFIHPQLLIEQISFFFIGGHEQLVLVMQVPLINKFLFVVGVG